MREVDILGGQGFHLHALVSSLSFYCHWHTWEAQNSGHRAGDFFDGCSIWHLDGALNFLLVHPDLWSWSQSMNLFQMPRLGSSLFSALGWNSAGLVLLGYGTQFRANCLSSTRTADPLLLGWGSRIYNHVWIPNLSKPQALQHLGKSPRAGSSLCRPGVNRFRVINWRKPWCWRMCQNNTFLKKALSGEQMPFPSSSFYHLGFRPKLFWSLFMSF